MARSFSRMLKTAAHVALAACPSAVKIPIYRRVFGFKIDKGASIGMSVLDVDHLEMDATASIGHGNVLTRTHNVSLAEGAEIGFLNLFRGGDEVRLDKYATVLRMNVLNSIPENDCEGTPDARLLLAPGAYIVSGHRLDFTDRISLGKNVVVAGRNSSFWTHQARRAGPIDIGDFSYLGSEVRIAPGSSLGPYSILGMGSVVAGSWSDGRAVLGGVPARPIRPVTADDEKGLEHKTKKSIPDDLY